MTEANVFQLSQPGSFADPLTEVLRHGARTLLAQAVEAEVAAVLASHADTLTDDGRQRLVRHGHLPQREIMTGIGPVTVRCPRVRDRAGEGSERIRFSSAIPAWEKVRSLARSRRASQPVMCRRTSRRCRSSSSKSARSRQARSFAEKSKSA